jgi:hypothetical protein
LVEEGSQTPGNMAEDGAIKKPGFAIVLNGAFQGRNIKVNQGVITVAAVANFPRVVGEEVRYVY